MKQNLQSNEVSLYCDFSENYVLKHGEEVQSCHFGASQQQVSLHTGAFYYNENNEIQHKSFATVCKNTRHDPAAIWAHLKPVIKQIKEIVPNADTLFVQSDGPTSQYRNRKNFYLMSKIPSAEFKKVSWNFFEAGHGKSVADAIGSVVKNECDKSVARGKDIANVSDLLERMSSSKTSVMEIHHQDIIETEKDIPLKLKPIPKCLEIHEKVWNRDSPDNLTLLSKLQ